MKAQLARFVISLIAMLIALITFIEMDIGWLSAGLIVIMLVSGLSLSEAVFRRLADQETIRRDLEERVRNQHL
jgi:predicted Na+-dependent transporter